MTTPNVALLNQTLAYIEAHPEEWDQKTWHCGTTACFAGHAAALNGGEWLGRGSDSLIARDDDPAEDIWAATEDRPAIVEVDRRAKRVLGLTDYQAEDLFEGGNSLDDLREIVAKLTGSAS